MHVSTFSILISSCSFDPIRKSRSLPGNLWLTKRLKLHLLWASSLCHSVGERGVWCAGCFSGTLDASNAWQLHKNSSWWKTLKLRKNVLNMCSNLKCIYAPEYKSSQERDCFIYIYISSIQGAKSGHLQGWCHLICVCITFADQFYVSTSIWTELMEPKKLKIK